MLYLVIIETEVGKGVRFAMYVFLMLIGYLVTIGIN